MRAAMQRLLKTVGLYSESFATPLDFSGAEASKRSQLPRRDVRLPGISGLESKAN
jgi:FixJ family two-component response regulator